MLAESCNPEAKTDEVELIMEKVAEVFEESIIAHKANIIGN